MKFKGKRGQVGVYTKQCNERRSKAMVISLATLPSVSILEPVVKHLGYIERFGKTSTQSGFSFDEVLFP
jgi:hypothetical protein